MGAGGGRTTRTTDVTADEAGDCEPFVHETPHFKSLHFSMSLTQSRMSKRDPARLVVDYTRTMMGFLIFNPQPRRIAMLGLGGGSLAKFCHRELPRACIEVVEIHPGVLALRDEFHVPPDDERFQVRLGDGVAFVEQSAASLDVLLVDAYSKDGIAAGLASQAFYDDCRAALTDGGVLVTNLYCDDVDAHLDRLRSSFGGAVFAVAEKDRTNRVAFACAGDAFQRRRRALDDPGASSFPDGWPLRLAFRRVEAALKAQLPA